MVDLKPCPFCGSIAELKGEGREWFVACTDEEECGAEGHRALVDAYAVECWNARASSSRAETGKSVALTIGDMPTYGKASWIELRQAVVEATTGTRPSRADFGHDDIFIGHQMVPAINFNSLNRIVSAFSVASPPTHGELVEARRLALEAIADKPLPPEVIAAAWGMWKSRHGGKLGPGPAFTEAVEAAIRALASREER